ncbi:DEAD/DEAH box helicase family protein [Planococcus chinensis]|uniref:DEAD/DEAH box helicase n=1 Tax=Planococcus chinensis TaxID=272917 RepID=A0ABW4QF43_9BACL
MTDLEAFLSGRIWLREFMPFPKGQVDEGINCGDITVVQGITADRTCARCLESSPQHIHSFSCAKCEGICFYCRHCIQMGRISSCTELVTWASPSHTPQQSHSFSWNGRLTPLQLQASEKVSESVKNRKSHLVYAVCGAGKTELLFRTIHEALQSGQSVCLAAPRVDVVLELAPRLQAVFPDTVVHTLYRSAPAQTGRASIVIATTHQLYRFQNTFDLMIVDEADAFPYSFDAALERAVLKAKTPEAPIVYVSATPSRKLLKEVSDRSEIFERYHGHPLPVPVFSSLWGYRQSLKKKRIPVKLAKWVKQKIGKGEPFLVFMPNIEMIDGAIGLFQELDSRIEAVHSRDSLRKEKVMGLRNGRCTGLLTSTILERGITIPNLQVAVVGAEDSVFEASALIQIAGRAGRSAEHPAGDVTFFHDGITREMDKAKNMISNYNRRKSY